MIFKKMIFPILLTAGLAFGACEQEWSPAEPGYLVPPTADQDPALPAIDVNGTRLHAETFGRPDDPMIIVLHGGPGGDYRSLLPCKALADDGYYVVFYDQRGSGLSQRHPRESYGIGIMTADLAAVIQKYRTRPDQKVFLLGHSWGAMLATAYIDAHPAEIAGAVLAEPGGFTWDDTKGYVERSQPLDVFSEASNDVLYADQFFTGKADEQEILDYKFQLAAAPEAAPGNITGIAAPYPCWRKGAVVSRALNELAQAQGFDWTTHLGSFQPPVLFVYSELNRAYGLRHAQRVSGAYPNVQLAEIKGVGHEMIYFGWDAFYPLARTYFNALK